MTNSLVSIIAPTYNVEPYLLKCLESINDQTYNNFECIIIVDGATDGSFDIAKKYCKNHSKFSVYWQENKGSGPARNNGLAHAKGEFVMFVDPDDWIKPDLLEKLVLAQNEGDYDITTSRKQSYIDKNGELTECPLPSFVHLNMISKAEMIYHHKDVIRSGYCSAPTRTLYKMSIIKNNHIEFPSLRRSQDVAFNCLYYKYANSFRAIEYTGYCYRIIPKEGVAKDRSRYHETFIYLFSIFEDLYNSWNTKYDRSFFATYLFRKYFYGSLRLCVKQGVDIIPILNNEKVYNILKYVKTSFSPAGVASALIKARLFRMAAYFLSLINVLKS